MLELGDAIVHDDGWEHELAFVAISCIRCTPLVVSSPTPLSTAAILVQFLGSTPMESLMVWRTHLYSGLVVPSGQGGRRPQRNCARTPALVDKHDSITAVVDDLVRAMCVRPESRLVCKLCPCSPYVELRPCEEREPAAVHVVSLGLGDAVFRVEGWFIELVLACHLLQSALVDGNLGPVRGVITDGVLAGLADALRRARCISNLSSNSLHL